MGTPIAAATSTNTAICSSRWIEFASTVATGINSRRILTRFTKPAFIVTDWVPVIQASVKKL